MTREILTFSYNNGGLNNQKLALLGLFIESSKTGLPIVIPQLYNLDHTCEEAKAVIPFSSCYALDTLLDFANRHQVTILPQSSVEVDSPQIGGWEFFSIGATHIASLTASNRMATDDIACDFFRSLVPSVRLQEQIEDLWAKLQDLEVGSLVVQMRIEKDWELFSKITLRPTVGENEDFLPSFSDIMAKVKNTLVNRFSKTYIVSDEAGLPVSKAEIKEVCSRVFGITPYWKSDFLDISVFEQMQAMEKSIIDFEIALRATCFVGLTRSSFSNLVTFERYSRTFADVIDHYVYNVRGPFLSRRFDNGAYAFAGPATTSRGSPL